MNTFIANWPALVEIASSGLKCWMSVNRACYHSAQHAKVLAWSPLSLLSRVGLPKVFCLCKSITRKSSFLCERVYLCVWVSGQWHSGEKHTNHKPQQLASKVPEQRHAQNVSTKFSILSHPDPNFSTHISFYQTFLLSFQWYFANSMFFFRLTAAST